MNFMDKINFLRKDYLKPFIETTIKLLIDKEGIKSYVRSLDGLRGSEKLFLEKCIHGSEIPLMGHLHIIC